MWDGEHGKAVYLPCRATVPNQNTRRGSDTIFSCLLLPATSLATHVASLQQVRQLWPAGRHCLVTFRAPCPLSNLSHIRVRCSRAPVPYPLCHLTAPCHSSTAALGHFLVLIPRRRQPEQVPAVPGGSSRCSQHGFRQVFSMKCPIFEKRIPPRGSNLQQKVARAQPKRFSNTQTL